MGNLGMSTASASRAARSIPRTRAASAPLMTWVPRAPEGAARRAPHGPTTMTSTQCGRTSRRRSRGMYARLDRDQNRPRHAPPRLAAHQEQVGRHELEDASTHVRVILKEARSKRNRADTHILYLLKYKAALHRQTRTLERFFNGADLTCCGSG